MSHEFESGFFVKEAAWFGVGKQIKDMAFELATKSL